MSVHPATGGAYLEHTRSGVNAKFRIVKFEVKKIGTSLCCMM